MKKKTAKHIIRRYYSEIKKNPGVTRRSTDPDFVHQLRVNFKKLRAFNRMISSTKKEKSKISAKLKTIYRIAGTIRDLQLLQQTLSTVAKKFMVPQEYRSSVQRRIETLLPFLLKLISKKTINASRKISLKQIPEKFPRKVFNQYIQKKQEQVNLILQAGNISNAGLHAVRKILKDISFNQHIFGNSNKPGPIHTLMLQMGELQDRNVSVSLIQHDFPGNFKSEDKQFPGKLISQWRKEISRLKKQVIAGIKRMPER